MADQNQSMLGGIFSKKSDKPFSLFGPKKVPTATLDANLASIVNDNSRRLMMLEERYSDLRRKSQVTEQNMIRDFKKINTEIKVTNSDLMEMKRNIEEIKGKIMLIIKELRMTARKEDVDVVQKYMDLWEPLKFVSLNEVEKIVNEIIESRTKTATKFKRTKNK